MSHIQDQIGILVEVESVDVEILRADRQITTLSNEAARLDRLVAEREAQVSAEKSALEDLRKAYRELESESKINAGMIAKSNEKLRAVKTNKEYQSILKEIEEIRKKISSIEDQMIEQLEAIESAEQAVAQKETELAQMMQSCQEKKETFANQAQRGRKVVATLNEKKAQISAKADPKIITILNDVRKKVRGTPVVPAVRATCMGCHMNIPAQLFNELQRCDEIRFCPHCHRIIYWQAKDSE